MVRGTVAKDRVAEGVGLADALAECVARPTEACFTATLQRTRWRAIGSPARDVGRRGVLRPGVPGRHRRPGLYVRPRHTARGRLLAPANGSYRAAQDGIVRGWHRAARRIRGSRHW